MSGLSIEKIQIGLSKGLILKLKREKKLLLLEKMEQENLLS